MAISNRLKELLQTAKARYTVMKHPVVYTAQEIAAAQHIPGRQLAKCVLVMTDTGPVLAVLPAIHLIALPKLKGLLKAKKLSIGREADIEQHFPDVEVGAMSPFGNLYGVRVIVDEVLAEAGDIVFNAGSHTDTIKMAYADFAKLVKPKVGSFGQPIAGPAPKKKAASGRRSVKRKATARRPITSRTASRRRTGRR